VLPPPFEAGASDVRAFANFEQIQSMRAAIDMVMGSLGPGVRGRAEVARAIVPFAGTGGHSASTMANLALEKMGFSHRVSDGDVSPTDT
jgi:hypothetical protein